MSLKLKEAILRNNPLIVLTLLSGKSESEKAGARAFAIQYGKDKVARALGYKGDSIPASYGLAQRKLKSQCERKVYMEVRHVSVPELSDVDSDDEMQVENGDDEDDEEEEVDYSYERRFTIGYVFVHLVEGTYRLAFYPSIPIHSVPNIKELYECDFITENPQLPPENYLTPYVFGHEQRSLLSHFISQTPENRVPLTLIARR